MTTITTLHHHRHLRHGAATGANAQSSNANAQTASESNAQSAQSTNTQPNLRQFRIVNTDLNAGDCAGLAIHCFRSAHCGR